MNYPGVVINLMRLKEGGLVRHPGPTCSFGFRV